MSKAIRKLIPQLWEAQERKVSDWQMSTTLKANSGTLPRTK